LPDQPRSFIPAAGFDWLLPLYDPLQWLLGGDALKRPLIEQAALASGMRASSINRLLTLLPRGCTRRSRWSGWIRIPPLAIRS
jgi:hypothetical protein